MHAQPPRTLKRLLKQYGQELIDDPRRTEALLRDHCGQHTREIFVLVNAQKQHVPNDLLSAPVWMPRQATYTRLSKTLQSKLALTEDAANWAVAAWAAALDIEALPKGEGWSWLPEPLRGPAPKTTRKSTSKKRQNSSSQVKSSKSTTTASAAKAKERAAHAEMGWRFPKIAFPTFNRAYLSQLSQFRLFKTPIVWSNLLPWIALLTATIFLLAVVYWTSSARPVNERGMTTPTTASASNQAATTESDAPFEAGAQTVSTVNVTPLPDLPQPASDYLVKVMPLPVWANVNAEEPLLVRQEPSTDAPYRRVLQNGAPVKVVAYSDDGRWSQIESPDAGWVSNQFLHFLNQATQSDYVTLNAQPRQTQDHEVNVLTEPSASAEVTSTLSPNEFIVVAAEMGEPPTWYQVADPVVGWVAANDLAPVSP